MKVNPKRKPRTEADVRRAYAHGHEKGTERSLVITLYLLQDKYNATDEDLQEFAAAYNKISEEIREGRITEADLRNVMKEEYGTVLAYGRKE